MSFIQADMGATVTVSLPGLAKLFEGIQTLQANQIDLGAKLEGLTAKVKELERQIEKTQHNILHESGESWVVAPTVAQASPPKENPQKQLNSKYNEVLSITLAMLTFSRSASERLEPTD